ncbi:MAG: ABC transporter ATP-binding protein, partial [Thermoanaerobaculia bacterium]
AAVDRGWVLLELLRERASLEDVFVRLTTGDEAAGPDEDDAEPAGTAEGDRPESVEEVES